MIHSTRLLGMSLMRPETVYSLDTLARFSGSVITSPTWRSVRQSPNFSHQNGLVNRPPISGISNANHHRVWDSVLAFAIAHLICCATMLPSDRAGGGHSGSAEPRRVCDTTRCNSI